MNSSLKTLLVVLIFNSVSAQLKQPFSPEYSQLLAYYGGLISCSKNSIENWNCSLCTNDTNLKDVKVFDSPGKSKDRALVGYSQDNKRIIVIWRGSDNQQNWISNLELGQMPYSSCMGCVVHSGFSKAVNDLPQVGNYVKNLSLKYPNSTITVAGRSRGGALAILSALQLQRRTNKVSEVYNFGSPAVGNGNFAKYVNKRIPTLYRVINGTDFVPKLLGEPYYVHSSQEIYYNKTTNQYKLCNDSSRLDPKCSKSVRFNLFSGIKDHTSYGPSGQECINN